MIERLSKRLWLGCFSLLSACGGVWSAPALATPPPAAQAPEEVRATLDLRSLVFKSEGLRALQASNYYPGVRTARGHALFLQAFPEHHVVRVNAFDWAAAASSGCVPGLTRAFRFDYARCIAQFEDVLKQSKPYLDDLMRRNSTQVLMVDIFRTPAWLSRSRDLRTACGGGVLAHAHRPANYQVWKQLLDVTAHFFRQYDGAVGINPDVATRIHYQFWNEPDLACNWQEDTAAFLELYAHTATHLRVAHPSARIGGPGTEAWDGRITRDGAQRPQNLAFDLADFARTRALPLDFLSWHYFSADYRGQLVDGVTAYRNFLASRGLAEASLPLVINEWLPQDGPPTGLHRYLAIDAANALLAMFEAGVSAQGGVPWQDYGPAKSDAWGIVAFNENGNEEGLADATKKPIFHVVELFDQLARTSHGLHAARQDIHVPFAAAEGVPPFKVGERALVLARENTGACHRLAVWNRIASPEQGAIAYLLGQGVTPADLARAYGSDPQQMLFRLVEAIRAGTAFDPAWTAAFRQARTVEQWLGTLRDRREFAYSIALPGWKLPAVSEARSIGRDRLFVLDKPMAIHGTDPRLVFSVKPEELVHARLCGA